MNNQIDCRKIYEDKKQQIIYDVNTFKELTGLPPAFIIYAGDPNDYGSQKYMELKQKTAEECGIYSKVIYLLPNNKAESTEIGWGCGFDCSQDSLTRLDNSVPSILQLPINPIYEKQAKTIRDYAWDIDYFDSDNTYDPDTTFKFPATAKAVFAILDQEIGLNNLAGKKVAIVGCRSKTVGRYLQPTLTKRDATVCMYHSKSIIKPKEFEDFDIVISCVGKANLIKQKHFGDNRDCICIDIGVSRNEETGKVNGDFDRDIREYQRYTPYVNGVGLLTRIFLMESLIRTYFNHMQSCYGYNKESNRIERIFS